MGKKGQQCPPEAKGSSLGSSQGFLPVGRVLREVPWGTTKGKGGCVHRVEI